MIFGDSRTKLAMGSRGPEPLAMTRVMYDTFTNPTMSVSPPNCSVLLLSCGENCAVYFGPPPLSRHAGYVPVGSTENVRGKVVSEMVKLQDCETRLTKPPMPPKKPDRNTHTQPFYCSSGICLGLPG